MIQPTGYSGTPLGKKLGVKPGFRIKTKNAPNEYRKMLRPLPDDVVISARLRPPVDLWHVFSKSRSELGRHLPSYLEEIPPPRLNCHLAGR